MKEIGIRVNVFICPSCNHAFEYDKTDIETKYEYGYDREYVKCGFCKSRRLLNTCILKTYIKIHSLYSGKYIES